MLVLIEFAVVIAIVMAFCCSALGSGQFEKAERSLSALGRRRTLSVVVVGLLALAGRAAVLPILPSPKPHINDEFSYLLQAETFAHGRLANPTHPMWVHFETLHVNMRPTYASKYPPAQSLALALGQVLTGNPFFGVWLSVGIMCAAICWMLQGWMDPEWAFLGGLIAVMRLGIFGYWANSYWGGAVAATGGALVVGALPRLMRLERVRDALWMSLGLVVLANSRPYEGLVLSLPVVVALFLWWLGKNAPARRTSARRVLAPMVIVGGVGAVLMGYYFWKVAGNPFRMPYQINEETYDAAPFFAWQKPKPTPVYRDEALRYQIVGYELPFYRETHSLKGLMVSWVRRTEQAWLFFLGPALTLPLLTAMAAVPYGFTWWELDRRTRFMILLSVATLAGLAGEVYFQPHYAAPLTCVILALILSAIRYLRGWEWHGKRVGLFLMRAVPTICGLILLLLVTAAGFNVPVGLNWADTWYNGPVVKTGMAKIEAQLSQYRGEHLVIVGFNPNRPPAWYDWVRNGAEIDQQRIVWGRDMGPVLNQELIHYFKSRHVWLVEPDEDAPGLRPYPAGSSRESQAVKSGAR
jgi:hypothetical protein